MKIGIITDDGKTISAHFGSAAKLAVYEVVDGAVIGRELRDKPGHSHHDHEHGHGRQQQDLIQVEEQHDHEHQHGEGHQHGGHGRFQQKLAVMQDCQVILARGMGHRAYENLQQAGLQPITTDIKDIETAVQAYIDGTIIDNPRRRH